MVKAAKLSISLAVVCLLVAFGVSSAQADQITFGPSTQAVTFTNLTSSTLSLQLGTTVLPGAGCVSGDDCLSGFAHAGATSGTFSLSTATSPLDTVNSPPVNLNEFPITGGVTSAFSYAGSNGSSLAGTVTYNFVADGTPTPQLEGTLLITAVTGSDLTSSYTVGTQTEFDFTLSTLSGLHVDKLFSAPAGTPTMAAMSSGEAATPEPASLLLFGTGLLGFAFLLRRKKLLA